MCSKQKIRKTALILLLATLISLIPSNTFRVFADSDIVPPFPYDELQIIGENDYALFKVHGVDQVDYIEVLMPRINAHGNFQHLCPGLSYSNLGGWVLQINSIDYYFKNGQSVYFDLQSLFTTSFMPVENDDNYFPAWLEFVYTTEEIWGIDEDSNQGRGLKWFKDQNFIIPPAATPTPTPIPDSDIPTYAELPTFTITSNTEFIDQCTLVVKCTQSGTLNGYSYSEGNYYAAGASYANSPWYYYYVKSPHSPYTLYGGVMVAANPNGNFDMIFSGGRIAPRVFSISYDVYNNIITGGLNTGSTPICDLGVNSYGYHCYATYFPIENIQTWYDGQNNINIVDTARFELVACNNGSYRGNGNLGSATPTPTPTTAPTPIPQPSTTPEPEDPNNNSSWGWGIVNTLRYIFIPDKNKLIRLEKTAQTKFQQFGGGYDDLKRVSGFEDPVRPQNVVLNWTPFSTDLDEQQPQQQITLVDFEQIDFYLFQTSSGMFIKDCLSASFTFLMFGYLIHVIRKHFVIENTDDDEKGGGD